MPRTSHLLEVNGREVSVSNLGKPMFPTGFTKGEAIDYYIRISDHLLPHLKDRPITLKRYPNGTTGKHFYEKDAPDYTPKWVPRFPVPRRSAESDICYILINNLPTLVWSVNLANLEMHPFLHRVPTLDTPTALVFDLDPGEGATILQCAEIAFLLKKLLDAANLRSFVKVSGSKGLQVYTPVNGNVTYAVTQPYAHGLAQTLEREHRGLVVSEMAKELRKRKVFIDWSQNSDFKTTVAPYSLRAKQEQPYVSLPIRWKELADALKSGRAAQLYFTPEQALARVSGKKDLFAPVLSLKQKISQDGIPHAPKRTTSRAS
jgi:bifunctional non-homologous end joining protein LigD